VFSGFSSVSTRDAEGPGDCGSGVFTAEEVDGVGKRGTRDTTLVNVVTFLEAFFGGLPDLELFSSTAIVSGFPEDKHLD
jgi:hypothetical protein